MTVEPTGSEVSQRAELYPDIAAVASTYGDPKDKYAAFLAEHANGAYVKDAQFYWNQPLDDYGFDKSTGTTVTQQTSTGAHGSSTSSASNVKSTVGTVQDNSALGLGLTSWRAWGVLYGSCAIVMVASFVEFL